MEELLYAERTRSTTLEANVNHLESSLTENANRVNVLTTQEGEFLERIHDLVGRFPWLTIQF